MSNLPTPTPTPMGGGIAGGVKMASKTIIWTLIIIAGAIIAIVFILKSVLTAFGTGTSNLINNWKKKRTTAK